MNTVFLNTPKIKKSIKVFNKLLSKKCVIGTYITTAIKNEIICKNLLMCHPSVNASGIQSGNSYFCFQLKEGFQK